MVTTMTMRMMMVVVVMKTAEIINSSSTFHYGIINSEKKMWISKPIHMKWFLEIKWYFSCLRYEKLNGAVFQLIEMHLSCWSKSTTDKMGSSNSPGRENGYKSFSDKYFGTLKKRSFSFNLSTVNSNCIIHWMRVWKLKKPLNEKSRDGSLERRKRSG